MKYLSRPLLPPGHVTSASFRYYYQQLYIRAGDPPPRHYTLVFIAVRENTRVAANGRVCLSHAYRDTKARRCDKQ